MTSIGRPAISPPTLDAELASLVDDSGPIANRLQSLLDAEIQFHVHGLLTVWIASITSNGTTTSAVLDVAVAIDTLHLQHYLHSIPQAEPPFHPPAIETVYANAPSTAILDGDYVKSRAFCRLSHSAAEPAVITSLLDEFARSTRRSYETHVADTPHESMSELTAAAAVTGARLGEVHDDQLVSIRRAARDLGAVLPVALPDGPSIDPLPDRRTVDRQLSELTDVLPGEASCERMRADLLGALDRTGFWP